MNLTESTETNSTPTGSKHLDTLVIELNEARAKVEAYDSVPPIVRRVKSAKAGQRFQTAEDFAEARQNEVGRLEYDAKMNFLANIRSELGIGPSAEDMAEMAEQERIAAEKRENIQLEAEFAKASE